MAEKLTPLKGFVGPSNTLQAQRFADEKTQNWYIELSPTGSGKGGEPAVLLPTPGLRPITSLGSAAIRGLYTPSLGGASYVVCGNKIYSSSNQFATTTEIGTLLTTAGPVQFADQGSAVTDPYVILVDGTYGYTFAISAPAASFAQISSANFFPANTISFQDGYFILNNSGTGYFFLSELNAITFAPLNEALKSGYGDNLVGVISNNRSLYLLGTRTLEEWWNSGASAVTPFQRVDGNFHNIGCLSASTIKKLDDMFFWLGQNEQGSAIVYAMAGQPQRVSNTAVELSLQSVTATQLAASTAFAQQINGHFFYFLNVPGTNTTWVFDTNTKTWHERQTTINGNLSRHLAENITFTNNKYFCGSYIDGQIYQLDREFNLDGTQPIQRLRRSPHISGTLNNVVIRLLQLDCQSGVGTAAGLESNQNPQLVLRTSKDGGKTFGAPRLASLGRVGQYKTRQRFSMLGMSRDWILEISMTDAVSTALLSAYVDIELCNA